MSPVQEKLRSELKKGEDKKKNIEQAIYDLRRDGILIPFDSRMHLYHGQVNMNGQQFQVVPKFSNAGNATGNANVNAMAGLHTSSEDVARRFADARFSDKKWDVEHAGGIMKGKPEVHRILASAPDCYFFDLDEYFGLDKEERKKVDAVFGNLVIRYSMSEIMPWKFEDREQIEMVHNAIKKYLLSNKKYQLGEEDIDKICKGLGNGVSKDLVYERASNHNTAFMALNGNIGYLIYSFAFANGAKRQYVNGDLEKRIPMNMEFVGALADKIGIIGVKGGVRSATLGEEITDYFIFETDKVNTEAFVKKQQQKRVETFGAIAEILENCVAKKEDFDFLVDSTPEETMAWLQNKIPQLQKYYQKSAGVWEGFSIGEHTETVLRVLEDSFANDVPPELLPFIKLTIAMHDVGKGEARERGIYDHDKEMEITKQLTEKAMAELGMDDRMVDLMEYLFHGAQYRTGDYYFKKDDSALAEAKEDGYYYLARIVGHEATSKQADGVVELAKTLQTCDSGAYTRMGVTRDKDTDVYYYNGNDRFTKSMESPTDIRSRKQRLKEPQVRTQ